MRLDHIAYRVNDRHKTAKFFKDTLGYTLGTEFEVEFNDGSKANCIALVPPETRHENTSMWIYGVGDIGYHAPPEIFISDGPSESIIGNWVSERNDIGGIHHIAYQVEDVGKTMEEWRDSGYAEFLSDEPLVCPGLVQVFTKPSELTGVIYELISREGKGFCEDNVKNLMLSTAEDKKD